MSEPVKPIREILVPMDFSDCSKNALEFAKRVAEPHHARIHLLYVDDDPGMISSTTSEEYRDEYENKMAMKFVDLMTPEQRERYRTVMAVKCGTAYHEIEQYAREHQIELIVLGSVGRTAIADALLGSVASHVIRRAPCPVLAVRMNPH